MLRSRAPWLTVALLVLMMMLPVVVSGSRHLGLRGSHLALMSLVVAFTTGMLRAAYRAAVWRSAARWRCWGCRSSSAFRAGRLSTGTGESLGVRLSSTCACWAWASSSGWGCTASCARPWPMGMSAWLQFQGLLQMAVDWYWEMDQHFRFTHIVEMTAGISGLGGSERIGRTPWQIDIGLSDEDLDAHRADLESHRPSRLARAPQRRSRPAALVSISGEPRFDAMGNFRGYWGHRARRDARGGKRAVRAGHRGALPRAVPPQPLAAGGAPLGPRARRQPRCHGHVWLHPALGHGGAGPLQPLRTR